MVHKNALATLLFTAAALGAQSALAQDAAAKGRQIYEVSCMHCHGANADGKGAVVDFLKIQPADLTVLGSGASGCITERVLKAVLGRHAVGNDKAHMPLLKDALAPEEVYLVSEYVKSVQK